MIAKLFAVVLIAFVAISEATTFLTTYSDAACTTQVGFYASTEPCLLNSAKRATEADCVALTTGGPWFSIMECLETVGNISTNVSSDFQYVTYSSDAPCNFTTYEMIGTTSPQKTSVITYFLKGNFFYLTNLTITCNTGLLTVESCIEGPQCNSFDSMPNGVCTNITATGPDSVFNGIQTSCVAPPTVPMAAPVAVPMATPKAAPVATPAKKSDAVSLAIGSVVTLGTTAAILLW